VRANVIVPDLNPCGGGERLTLVTMQALSQMRIDFDLTTLMLMAKPLFRL
jgi:hypothetical protein